MNKPSLPFVRRVLGFSLVLSLILIFSGSTLGQDGLDDMPLLDDGEGAPIIGASTFFGYNGAYAVIVDINTPGYLPEAQLRSANAIQAQRAAIQSSQAALVSELSAAGVTPQAVDSFRTLSSMAMVVDAAGLDALRNNPRVNAIYEDRLMEVQTEFGNDLVNAPAAWNTGSGYTGTDYAVAIFDTGVDVDHPALGSKIVAEGCFNSIIPAFSSVSSCPNDLVEEIGPGAGDNDDGSRYGDCDGCDHGTHVAGIAAGFDADAFGAGQAFNGVAPGADIISVNVFSIFTSSAICGQVRPGYEVCTLSFTSDQIRGHEWVAGLAENTGNGIEVAAVNMSLGGGRYFSEPECVADYSPSYIEVVERLNAANVAVVSSSGNDGWSDSLGGPACLPGIISVGSVQNGGDGTIADQMSGFSNSADFLDILAPGQSILSTQPAEFPPAGASDSEDRDGIPLYAYKSGTSMASPYVAGHFAILRQLVPDGTPEDLLAHMQATGDPITDPRNNITRSRINVGNSIFPAETTVFSPVGGTIDTQPVVTFAEVYGATSYAVSVSDSTPTEVDSGTVTTCADGVCEFTLTSALSLGDYTVEVTPSNPVGAGPTTGEAFTVATATPAGDIITTTPTFEFVDAGADWYQIVVEREGATTYSRWFNANDVCEEGLCAATPASAIVPGNALGDSELDWTLNTFTTGDTVQAGTPTTINLLAPALLAPTTVTEANGNPAFVIDELAGGGATADYYRVYFAQPGGAGVVSNFWFPADSCIAGECVVYPDSPIGINGNGTNYVAYLQAWSEDAGYSPWSAVNNITVSAPAPETGLGIDIGTNFANDILQRNVFFAPSAGSGGCAFGPNEGDPRTCPTGDLWFAMFWDVYGVTKGVQMQIVDTATDAVVESLYFTVDNLPAGAIPFGFSNAAGATIPIFGLPEGTYEWRLRAWGTGGESAWIEPGVGNKTSTGEPIDFYETTTFAVDLPAVVTDPVVPLDVIGEETDDTAADGTNGDLDFIWSNTGAPWYQLTVTNTTNNNVVYQQWLQTGEDATCGFSYPVGETTVNACAAFPVGPFVNAEYSFNVAYWTGPGGQVVPADAQNAFAFTQDQPAPANPLQAEMTVRNEEELGAVTGVTFEWPEIEGVTWYRIAVEGPTGAGSIDGTLQWLRAASICDDGACEYTVSPELATVPGGAYTWYLRSYGPGGSITDWVEATFSITTDAPVAPTLESPTGGAIVETNAPDFIFTPAETDNATWYNLRVFNAGTDVRVLNAWVSVDDLFCDGDGCYFSEGTEYTDTLGQGNYDWVVRAYGPAQAIASSTEASFQVQVPVSSPAELYAPADGSAISQGAAFDIMWFAADNAQWYQVVVQQGDETVLAQWLRADAAGCDSGCTFPVPANTLPQGEYTWYIRTWGQGNTVTPLEAPLSETWDLTIIR